MESFDYLASASATLITAKPGFSRFMHIVANGHVALPMKYLKLYPAEQQSWLQHVAREDCAYELSVVAEDGSVLAKSAVTNAVVCQHEVRDLAVLYLEDEFTFLGNVAKAGVDIMLPELDTRYIGDQDAIGFAGHVVGQDFGAPDEATKPLLVEGRLRGQTINQTFFTTAEPLKQGFCGCPALFEDATCAGVVDGIVAPLTPEEDKTFAENDPRRIFAGCASIVPAETIIDFLKELEDNDEVKKVLGPPAVPFIDPNKVQDKDDPTVIDVDTQNSHTDTTTIKDPPFEPPPPPR